MSICWQLPHSCVQTGQGLQSNNGICLEGSLIPNIVVVQCSGILVLDSLLSALTCCLRAVV